MIMRVRNERKDKKFEELDFGTVVYVKARENHYLKLNNERVNNAWCIEDDKLTTLTLKEKYEVVNVEVVVR